MGDLCTSADVTIKGHLGLHLTGGDTFAAHQLHACHTVFIQRLARHPRTATNRNRFSDSCILAAV